MDSIFPGVFNNPDPPTFTPDGINPDPMTISGDDSLLGNINSPLADLSWSNLDDNLFAMIAAMENPSTVEVPMIIAMENPPTVEVPMMAAMENPPTVEVPMIAANSVVTGVVWPRDIAQDEFSIAVDQVLPPPDLASSSGILPPLQRRSGAQVREATDGSLGDNSDKSDHDEIEGEILEITEDMDPAEAKRVKRMQSNRESAKRSRERKQVQMNIDEEEVDQLRGEVHRSSMDMFREIIKCATSGHENKNSKAEMVIIKAQVSECEEKIKRMTRIHPLEDQQFLSMASNARVRLPFFSSPIHASTNYALPGPSNVNQFFHQLVSSVSGGNPFHQPHGTHNTFANGTT